MLFLNGRGKSKRDMEEGEETMWGRVREGEGKRREEKIICVHD